MTHHYIVYIVLLEIEFERGNKMIKIDTKNVKEENFEANVQIIGSGKEVLRDFYSLHDTLQRNTEIALLYGIAIKKWESEHEDK